MHRVHGAVTVEIALGAAAAAAPPLPARAIAGASGVKQGAAPVTTHPHTPAADVQRFFT